MGGEFLSTEYKNAHGKLRWKCHLGHEWEQDWHHVKNRGQWCPHPDCCRSSKKYDIEFCRDLASKSDGRCLSNEYKGIFENLDWECSQGHLFERPLKVIKKGKWCPECESEDRGKLMRVTKTRELQELVAPKGGTLLTPFEDWRTKLLWQCSEGHRWKARAIQIRSGAWCRTCARTRTSKSMLSPIADVERLAELRGGSCTGYDFERKKYTFKCALGHHWAASLSHIKYGKWCPDCARLGLGERLCRIYFQEIFGKKFPKIRPKWLRGAKGLPLELDGYCASLNLAFEHQGKHHDKQDDFFHSKEADYQQRLIYDETKRRICRERGIVLIEIHQVTTKLPIDKLAEEIFKKCTEAGIAMPPIDPITIKPDLGPAYSPVNLEYFNQIKEIARQKDGVCTSTEYGGCLYKLDFLCANGHNFQATPSSIQQGKWCPVCARIERKTQHQQLQYEFYQALTVANSGRILTPAAEYINAQSKVEWECSEGHRWEATPNAIQQGQWCRICGHKKRWAGRKTTIEEMHQLAISRGGKCLSSEYTDSHTRLRWSCSEGHEWEAIPTSVKRGSWCKRCACRKINEPKKPLIDTIRKIAKSKGGKLLSQNYLNASKKLKWQCKAGHQWEASWNQIQQGRWCPKCAAMRRNDWKRLTIEQMRELAEERGGKCLSNKYVDARTKLSWRCSKAHKWLATPDHIKRGQWCKLCKKRKRG